MPCLLIGTNPRWEAPLVNARLRKRYLHGGCHGRRASAAPVDLTYPVERAGRRPGDAAASWPTASSRFCRDAEGRQERRCSSSAWARWPGRTARAMLGAGARARRRAAAWCARTGTASTCCTPRRRASAASISAWCRATAAATSRASWPAAEQGEIERASTCSAPTRSTPSGSARPS